MQIDAGSSNALGLTSRRSLTPSGPFELGKHTVTLTLADSHQSASCTATVVVQVPSRESLC